MRKLHVQFALVLATFQCLLIHVLGRFITPINNANIHLAVRNWLDDPVNAEAKFGHIKDWKTYKVTDMTGLFRYTDFNDDISGWNVSQVTSFKQLLYRNDKFNGDISKWQTNKVVDMSFAFGGASSFNGDIQHWDISRVKSLKGCFWEATSFNGNVNSWVVTSLTDASAAFASASSFDREVCWEFKDKSVKLDRIFCDSPGRFNTSCSSTLMTGIAPCDDLSGKEEDGSTAGSSFETDVPKKPKNFFDRWQLSTAGGVIFLLVLVSALALFVALHFGLIRQSMCKARNIARSSDGNIFPASDGNTVTADWHTVGLNDDPFDEESIVQTDSVVF